MTKDNKRENTIFILSMSKSIPETPNRKPVSLIVVVSACIPIAAVQVAEPGTGRIALRRTPPVTVVANATVIPTAAAVTARKTSK